jgi:hypothetical protein
MTAGHILYLPVILLIGMAFGYVLGAKAGRREFEAAKKKAKT